MVKCGAIDVENIKIYSLNRFHYMIVELPTRMRANIYERMLGLRTIVSEIEKR